METKEPLTLKAFFTERGKKTYALYTKRQSIRTNSEAIEVDKQIQKNNKQICNGMPDELAEEFEFYMLKWYECQQQRKTPKNLKVTNVIINNSNLNVYYTDGTVLGLDIRAFENLEEYMESMQDQLELNKKLQECYDKQNRILSTSRIWGP